MIPLSQAVYRKGRSTTEHVFAMKILCEKAMTSCDYPTHILLLDMTKEFDTINREHLHRLLLDILDPDELNIMNILLKDVTLQVKKIKQKDKLLQLYEFHKDTVSVQFFLHCTFQIYYQQKYQLIYMTIIIIVIIIIIMVIFMCYFSGEHIALSLKNNNGVNIELGKTNRLKALCMMQINT